MYAESALPTDLRKYLRGYCDVMAIAIHQLTGLPLAIVAGVWVDEDGETEHEFCHCACSINSSLFLDAQGVVTRDSLLAAATFTSPVIGVDILPASAADIDIAFCGQDPALVEQAKCDFLKHHSDLATRYNVVASHGPAQSPAI